MKSVAERYFAGQDDNYVGPTRSNLDEALSDVSYVSRVLHGIENGDELSVETLSDLCVSLFKAEGRLSALKEAERRPC